MGDAGSHGEPMQPQWEGQGPPRAAAGAGRAVKPAALRRELFIAGIGILSFVLRVIGLPLTRPLCGGHLQLPPGAGYSMHPLLCSRRGAAHRRACTASLVGSTEQMPMSEGLHVCLLMFMTVASQACAR